jgi:hypothetical protein
MKAKIDDELSISEFVEHKNIPDHDRIVFETHQPITFTKPYHHHSSIELNFLEGCSMTYSFSGAEVVLQDRQLAVFWGAKPHKVINVVGTGTITNAYISLSQFLQWGLPTSFTDAVLSGSVISTKEHCEFDQVLIKSWKKVHAKNSDEWSKVHLLEIQSRFKRLVLEGWTELLIMPNINTYAIKGGKALFHFEKMLKFISDNFANNISTQDISAHAGISKSYGILLFKKMLGVSV